MAGTLSLISGFSESDSKKVDLFLQKLFSHLEKDEFIIVGGLAIRYHLTQKGISYPVRDFNDLDIKITTPSILHESVSRDFLIYHYHPENNGSFYIVLIDPETKIKIDIFDMTIKDEETIRVPFHDQEIKVVRLEDQFVKTVYDIQRISEDKKVDPKQFLDTKLMETIVDMELANTIWKKRGYSEYPDSITEAIQRAREIATKNPDWVQEKPFKRLKPYDCPGCKSVAGFTITPMSEVYKILGYTE